LEETWTQVLQSVCGHVEQPEARVERHGELEAGDAVAPETHRLHLGVQLDGQHLQLGVLAGHDERCVVALAPRGTHRPGQRPQQQGRQPPQHPHCAAST